MAFLHSENSKLELYIYIVTSVQDDIDDSI